MSDELVQVAERIWLFPAESGNGTVQPNVGVIVTETGSVLVDAGNSPRHGRRILRALAARDLPPVLYVIYTHHHWDHIFGAQVYVAPVVAHDLCHELLVERAARPWGFAYIEDEIRRNPATEPIYTAIQRANDDWQGFRVVLPSLTFTHRMALEVGGRSIGIEHVGGQHAPDSVVVRVRDAGVLFVSDCFYKPTLLHRTADATTDYALVERFLADESIQVFIDGHTPAPYTREAVSALLPR